MKTSSISITIPQPCSQNWETMDRREGKRFCESCQKSVIDFSDHSNAEIIKLLSSATSTICGRLTKRQLDELNYYLIVVPTQRNWMKYLGVLAIGSSIFMQGCEKAETSIPVENVAKKASTENTERVSAIYGYVIDDYGVPAAGVDVVIENTKLLATTDSMGRYQFTIDENLATTNNLLRLSSRSLEGSVVLDYTKAAQHELKAESTYVTMGMVMITPPKATKNK